MKMIAIIMASLSVVMSPIDAQQARETPDRKFAVKLLASLTTGRIDEYRSLCEYAGEKPLGVYAKMEDFNRSIRMSEMESDYLWVIKNLPPEDRRSFRIDRIVQMKSSVVGCKKLRIVVSYGFDSEARFAITTGDLKPNANGELKMQERFQRPFEFVKR